MDVHQGEKVGLVQTGPCSRLASSMLLNEKLCYGDLTLSLACTLLVARFFI